VIRGIDLKYVKKLEGIYVEDLVNVIDEVVG
jgi:hypothetical protein